MSNAPDDTKLEFSTNWDIDQLVDSGTTTISTTGDVTVTTIPGNPTLPVFLLQFKPTGSSYWYQAGTNITDNLSSEFTFYGYILGSSLKINTTRTGTARYFIWSDKIDY